MHEEIRQAILYLRGATKKEPTVTGVKAVVEMHENDCWIITLVMLSARVVFKHVVLIGKPCLFCAEHALVVGRKVLTKRWT